MPGLGLLIPIVLLAGLFFWFRASRGEVPADGPQHGRISLLMEAIAYVGAVLMLAGAVAAMAQKWDDLAEGVAFALLAGSAVLFLGIGFVTRRSAEPAFGRLTSVVWLISTAAVAGALAELMVSILAMRVGAGNAHEKSTPRAAPGCLMKAFEIK